MNKYAVVSLVAFIIYPLIGNAAMIIDLSYGSEDLARFLMLTTEALTVAFMAVAVIAIISGEGRGVLASLLSLSVLIMFLDRFFLSVFYTVALYD